MTSYFVVRAVTSLFLTANRKFRNRYSGGRTFFAGLQKRLTTKSVRLWIEPKNKTIVSRQLWHKQRLRKSIETV